MPISAGNCCCSAIAKGSREPDNKRMFKFPVIEITAPAEMIAPPAVPKKCVPASANGFCDCANPGNVPTQTTCTRM